jgi:hypothetical protein
MRSPVFFSTPFIKLTTNASAGISFAQAVKFSRRVWDGTERYTWLAPASTVAISEDAVMAAGRFTPGK